MLGWNELIKYLAMRVELLIRYLGVAPVIARSVRDCQEF